MTQFPLSDHCPLLLSGCQVWVRFCSLLVPACLDPLLVDGSIHSLETSGQLMSPPVCIHSHHPEEESVLRVEEILQIESLMCLPIP